MDRANVTFRDIEHLLKIADELHEPQASLEIWYELVRDTPIADLAIEDICKACRQVLYPEYVVPEAIRRLKQEPLAGEKYDGELLVSLGDVPRDYWQVHAGEARVLFELVSKLTATDPELAAEITRLSKRLQ